MPFFVSVRRQYQHPHTLGKFDTIEAAKKDVEMDAKAYGELEWISESRAWVCFTNPNDGGPDRVDYSIRAH